MTLTTTASRVNYAGSGSTGPFSVPFRFDDEDDLLVIHRAADGTETELTITTDYTVSGAGDASGSVTLVDELASGATLAIIRRPAVTQPSSFRNQGTFRGASHETALDRQAMLVQALQEQLDRCVGVLSSWDPSQLALRLMPEPGKLLAWDAAGAGLTNRDPTDLVAPAAAPEAQTAWVEAARSMALQGNRPLCVRRVTATSYLFYRHLGGRVWMEGQLTTGGVASGPYSWNQTYLREILGYLLADDAACVYDGAWDPALGSQDPKTYIGGNARQAQAAGLFVTVTIPATFGGGDIYVVFVGRTSGNFVSVTLDGSSDACDALPSNGTYRYIDTYTATDLQYKQIVKVASNVSAGAHTLVLTVESEKNASSAGDDFLFNAVAFSGVGTGLPYQANTRAPAWQATTAYAQYDQIEVEGRHYSCSIAGTSGATAPTHTSGSAADGTVTWLHMAASSYARRSHRLQAAGSQLEYAYEYRPSSGGSLEDVGGILHGNEELDALEWLVDGLPADTPAVAEWLIGENVTLRQTINATHSSTGATVINQTTLVHSLLRDRVNVAHRHAWQVAGVLGFFYAHMWPLLAYSVATEGDFRWGFDRMATPSGGTFERSTYNANATNPIVGRTEDYVMAAWGDVLMPIGAAGVPSAEIGPLTALALLSVAPDSVNRYGDAATLFAGMAMNTNGADAPGFSSHPLKMYFERVADDTELEVGPGAVWNCVATYYLLLVPGSTIAFPPQ